MASNLNDFEINDTILERTAKAIWETQKKQEIKIIDDFEFDWSVFEIASNIIVNSSNGMAIIAGWSLISQCLEHGIVFHLKHGSKKDQKEFFKGFGPLATDSARIRFVLLMGWISSDDRDLLNSIRRVRNELAHGIVKDSDISFPDNLENRFKDRMDKVIDSMISAARDVDDNNIFGEEISNELRWRMYFFIVAGEVLEFIVCGPGRQRLGIQRNRVVFFDWDEAPNWAQDGRRAVAKAVLEVGASKAF